MHSVLVADAKEASRQVLCQALSYENDFSVLQAERFSEALTMVERLPRFDLVLVDLELPDFQGVEDLRDIISHRTQPQLAVIADHTDRETIDKALMFGAAGFVPKAIETESLIKAARFMADGETYVPIDYVIAGGRQKPSEPQHRLSRREAETLRHLCKGLSNKEIANELGVQEVTAKLHVKTLCQKLGAKNRTHAAMIARDCMYF
ncbi:MAG: response regulator transcription factor [Pseudomonadota bacterium]